MKKIIFGLIFLLMIGSVFAVETSDFKTGEEFHSYAISKMSWWDRFLFQLQTGEAFTVWGEKRRCDVNPSDWCIVTSASNNQVITCNGLLNIYNVNSDGSWSFIQEIGRTTYPATWTIWVPSTVSKRAWECYKCPTPPCSKDSDCTIYGYNKCDLSYNSCYKEVCVESWSCGSWSACTSWGTQTRICIDSHNCGTTVNKPSESQSCTPSPTCPSIFVYGSTKTNPTCSSGELFSCENENTAVKCVSGCMQLSPCTSVQICSSGSCVTKPLQSCLQMGGILTGTTTCPSLTYCIGDWKVSSDGNCCLGECTVPIECTSGKTKCEDNQYYVCTNNQWTRQSSGDTFCIVPPPDTLPKISVISTDIKTVGDGNQVQGTIILKNTGASMTENYVAEMQVVPPEIGLMAVVSVPSYQKNCNPDTLANVYTTFKLNSNEQRTITLISPQTGVLKDGTYTAGFAVVKKCYLDDPYGDRSVNGVSGFVGEKGITISVGSKEVCGNGKCETGEKGICLSDCKVECNLDSICDGIESCSDCGDCLNSNNAGAKRCITENTCTTKIKHIGKESVVDECWGWFGAKIFTKDCVNAVISKFKSIFTEEKCSSSLTKEEFGKASEFEVLNTICETTANCNIRTDFNVACASKETAGISIDKTLADKIITEIFGDKTKKDVGVCLATPVAGPGFDFCSIPNFPITKNCQTDVLMEYIGGLLILFLLFGRK